MREELQDALFVKYPKLLRKKDLKWGLQCGDGWYGIIDELCAVIYRNAIREDCQSKLPKAYKIKEKWGGLNFSICHSNDFYQGAIAMAESISFRTCEKCGLPGFPREGKWVITLCDEHYHATMMFRTQQLLEELGVGTQKNKGAKNGQERQ